MHLPHGKIPWEGNEGAPLRSQCSLPKVRGAQEQQQQQQQQKKQFQPSARFVAKLDCIVSNFSNVVVNFFSGVGQRKSIAFWDMEMLSRSCKWRPTGGSHADLIRPVYLSVATCIERLFGDIWWRGGEIQIVKRGLLQSWAAPKFGGVATHKMGLLLWCGRTRPFSGSPIQKMGSLPKDPSLRNWRIVMFPSKR